MGDFLHRMKSKLCPPAAITATAHKIAIIFYTLVTKQVEYDESLGRNAMLPVRNALNKNCAAKPNNADSLWSLSRKLPSVTQCKES